MNFNEFIERFDVPGKIVLLEGKREVLEKDKEKLVALGRLIASKTKHLQFRSGNATGADHYFSLGVAEVDANKLHVMIPYTSHRKKDNVASHSYSLEDINIAAENDLRYYSKVNKKNASLVDKYINGDRGRFGMKAACLIRDTLKVVGSKDSQIPRSNFAIFYDDLTHSRQGGTGHTMSVCLEAKVPFIDQRTWFQWLE